LLPTSLYPLLYSANNTFLWRFGANRERIIFKFIEQILLLQILERAVYVAQTLDAYMRVNLCDFETFVIQNQLILREI